MARSSLQKFSAQYPYADLAVVMAPRMDPACVVKERAPVNIVGHGRVIATFSRRRDAWRALRNCGYVKEGCFWRHKVASERPAALVALEVSDLMGDL